MGFGDGCAEALVIACALGCAVCLAEVLACRVINTLTVSDILRSTNALRSAYILAEALTDCLACGLTDSLA